MTDAEAITESPTTPDEPAGNSYFDAEILSRRPDLAEKAKAKSAPKEKAKAKDKEPEKPKPAEPAEEEPPPAAAKSDADKERDEKGRFLPKDEAEKKPEPKAEAKADAEQEPEPEAEAKPDDGEETARRFGARAAKLLTLIEDDPKTLEALKAALASPKSVVDGLIRSKKAEHKALKAERLVESKTRQIEAREQALSARERTWNDLEDLAKRDKFAVAKHLGITFRELAEEANRTGEDTTIKEPPSALEKKVDAILNKLDSTERELTATKAKLEEYEKAGAEHASAAKTQQELHLVNGWLRSNIDDFPYVDAEYPDHGALAEEVRGAIYYHFEQTGEELTIADVMRRLDRSLEERETVRQQRLSAKRRGAPQGVTERGNGAVKPAKPVGNSPSSLSTEDASQKTGVREMTRDERLNWAQRHFGS